MELESKLGQKIADQIDLDALKDELNRTRDELSYWKEASFVGASDQKLSLNIDGDTMNVS